MWNIKMPSATSEKSLSKSISMLKAVATPVMTIAAVVIMVAAAIKLTNSARISGAFCSPTFVFATLIAVVYRAINPIGWNLVLAGLGYPTNVIGSTRVWLLAESRRWLPGGIWGYASRATQAGELGVPVSVASASMLIELLITMAAAVIVSLVGVAFHYEDLAGTIRRMVVEKSNFRFGGPAVVALFIILVVLVFATHRSLIRKLTNLAEKFKLLADVKVDWSRIGAALGYMTLMAVINGTIGVCLLPIIDSTASVPVAAMIAATATAWIIGFLAFFSPGGVFVREAALATLLLPWIPYETGIAMAVLSRIAQLAAELICMTPIMLPGRRLSINLS